MALSDKRILEEVAAGNIIISPYDERNLATSSYDVTLGSFFYRPGNFLRGQIYNIYNEQQTRMNWGEVQVATRAELLHARLHGPEIADDDNIILLSPKETILAHTNEFVGGRNHITTMMKARSSMGRQGIAVCKCAGWGDVGYINRWTMEITNFTDYYIPLVVGRRIAQIVFFDTGPIREKDYAVQGKYQTSQTLEELEKNWKPEDMIPKLWKDRDIQARYEKS